MRYLASEDIVVPGGFFRTQATRVAEHCFENGVDFPDSDYGSAVKAVVTVKGISRRKSGKTIQQVKLMRRSAQ